LTDTNGRPGRTAHVLSVIASGSAQPNSAVLAAYVLQHAAHAGASTETASLYETPLPMFEASGVAQESSEYAELRAAVARADALLLVSPEYHGSMSGRMKNFLDLAGHELAGKLVGLVASTGGSLGTGCLAHMRAVLRACHAWAMPYDAAATQAVVDAQGLRDDRVAGRLASMGRDLAVYGALLRMQFQADKQMPSPPGFAGWHR